MSTGQKKNHVRVLVVSAHAADFVWRCSGTIANYTSRGDEVKVLCVTHGERGESGPIWKLKEGIKVEEVKEIRRKESEEAARILGANIVFLDWGDHPLVIKGEHYDILVKHLREFRPQMVITHHYCDLMNPDHIEVYNATMRAINLASVSGVQRETVPIPPVQIFLTEPHDPELVGFNPDTYIDITEVWPKKLEAMQAMKNSQGWLIEDFKRRGKHRALLSHRYSADQSVEYAESFKRVIPYVGSFF
jgi:4-oxalomesaconate hydratase